MYKEPEGGCVMEMVKKSNAAVFLFINAFLWGSSYVWSKMLLGYLSRFSVLFLCALGSLITITIAFYPRLKGIKRSAVLPSVLVSLFSVVSNIFFMFALQYTSSSNTAFIVQLSVIITPVLMALIEKKMLQGRIVASAIIAVGGLFLLTCDFSNFRLNIGDLLALGNALFFSAFLAGNNISSRKVDPVHFSFIHYATNTAAFFFMVLFAEAEKVHIQGLKSPVFAALISISILITFVTILLQSSAIKFVRPEKATLIYTMEPVTALILGYAFLGESLNGKKAVIGCVLILLAVVFSLYTPRLRLRLRHKQEISEAGVNLQAQ